MSGKAKRSGTRPTAREVKFRVLSVAAFNAPPRSSALPTPIGSRRFNAYALPQLVTTGPRTEDTKPIRRTAPCTTRFIVSLGVERNLSLVVSCTPFLLHSTVRTLFGIPWRVPSALMHATPRDVPQRANCEQHNVIILQHSFATKRLNLL